jgi:hypothetical protein
MIGEQIFTVEQLARVANEKRSVTSRNAWIGRRGHVPASVVLRMQATEVLRMIEWGMYRYEKGPPTSVFNGKLKEVQNA